MGNYHARCRAGEKPEVETPETYLSLFGLIPDFEKKISTVRSRDINISVIIQNIPQLKSRYPNDVWQEIIGNCDTQLFLGCTDETTAKYVSDRSGIATIDITSQAIVKKTMSLVQIIPEVKETASVGKRNILTQDEVLRLSGSNALVIIRGEKVLKVDKYDYSRHPYKNKMAPCRMCERIPEWRKRQLEEENKYKNPVGLNNFDNDNICDSDALNNDDDYETENEEQTASNSSYPRFGNYFLEAQEKSVSISPDNLSSFNNAIPQETLGKSKKSQSPKYKKRDSEQGNKNRFEEVSSEELF